MEFTEKIKQIVADRLENYKGQSKYPSDVGFDLTLSENRNNSWYCSYDKAKSDIKEYIDEFFDFVSWYKDNYGDSVDCSDLEKTHCLFMVEAVESVYNAALWETDICQNEKILIDDNFIQSIKEGLKTVNKVF